MPKSAKERKQIIDDLIANGVATEADRPHLNSASELVLETMCLNAGAGEEEELTLEQYLDKAPASVKAELANLNAGDDEDEEEEEDDPAPKKTAKGKVVKNAAPPMKGKGKKKDKGQMGNYEDADNAEPVTMEQYIAAAPPQIRELLSAGVQTMNAQRNGLIKTILANKANPYDEKFLKTQTTQMLQGMAMLASGGQQQNERHEIIPMFHGAQGAAPVGNAEDDVLNVDAGLPMPTMNFAARKSG